MRGAQGLVLCAAVATCRLLRCHGPGSGAVVCAQVRVASIVPLGIPTSEGRIELRKAAAPFTRPVLLPRQL
ncbi:uncharacterized protein SETTUDRAFT_161401 [Exserohilum turcica Et28A]|uniref:Secreted protein n=1 Tax=Exserohilum turcicum (strain 28A) TaxID=671987 RepID=R0IN32_EXST2|nr:uncharacterized protein SETTUDRAFT_161401 [Exserohilum turcica Et28A]EOA86181.1 hypothetical protein SETTUDRAFT_161401 [Exserohilum turcica Et28A]